MPETPVPEKKPVIKPGLDFDALKGFASDKDIDLSELNTLTNEERAVVMQIASELHEKGSSETLRKLWYNDYEEVPVDIDTFLDDPYYLGAAAGKNIFPYWRDMLREIFAPGAKYFEVIFSCSIGVGKSTIACLGIAYVLYKLLCLKNPQSFHGLTKSSVMTINFFNISKILAQAVGFAKFQSMVLKSPWFLKHGTVIGRQHLQYLPPKGIQLAIGSKSEHALGQDVFCVTGDTVVLTDSGEKTIEELAYKNVFFRVWQIDEDMVTILSDTCTAVQTKYTDELVSIELEDGTVFRCTPDHLVRLSDGTYKEAGKLTEEDDLAWI